MFINDIDKYEIHKMIKKIYFEPQINLSNDVYIEIIDGLIRRYHGEEFSPYILFGKKQKEPMDYHLKSEFKLEKISCFDRKRLGMKTNYKIISNELIQKTIVPTYIKLNIIEKFRIDYSKKETVFHEIKFKQLIVIGLFVTLPIGLLIVYLSKPNIFQKNSPNPNLKIINQDSINAIQTATTVSTKTIKFDRDSLSRK